MRETTKRNHSTQSTYRSQRHTEAFSHSSVSAPSRSAASHKAASAHKTAASHDTASSHKSSRHTNKSSRRKSNFTVALFKGAFVFVCCIVLAASITGIYGHMHSDTTVVYADENLSSIKYRSIKIEHGDSLWSIAEDNMSPGFSDINEYMDEIRECNQLSSDQINEGNYLMIPYYEVG